MIRKLRQDFVNELFDLKGDFERKLANKDQLVRPLPKIRISSDNLTPANKVTEPTIPIREEGEERAKTQEHEAYESVVELVEKYL